MSYENVKNSRQRLKARLLYVAGEKCAICGYDKCASALEFHHLNPNEKDFTLATNANIATVKALEEIKKCILVCANCHREIHANLIDDSQLFSSYSEEKAIEVLEELNNIKTKNLYYCKDCGKLISESKSQRCPDCAAKQRRVCERPSREELKILIRTIPFTKIAEKFDVSDNAIRKWCKSMNLPSKKQEINSISDSEWETI